MVRRCLRGDALLSWIREGGRTRRIAHRDRRCHHGADDTCARRKFAQSVGQEVSDRFGQHFHSIAWYVDDVPAISTHLAKHGLHMWDVTGRSITPPNEKFAVWTHPKETPGQLEFAVIERNTIDPRLQPAWSSEFWRERHPLGIERASHITTVVRDLGVAKKFYCDILGAEIFYEAETTGRKLSAFVAVGA